MAKGSANPFAADSANWLLGLERFLQTANRRTENH